MAVAPQRLPIPPEGVIPPEGLPPPPQATEATASPTTMILNYLQSRGFQPTTENVRRALEANSRDPGVIPGLRSDTGATEAEDQAAMAAARGGSRNTSAAPTSATPPPTPGTSGTFGPGQSPVEGPTDGSGANPTDRYGAGFDWTTAALGGGAGALGAGGGALLAKAILDRARMGRGEYVGNAQVPSGKITDVDLPPQGALPSPGSMEKQMLDALAPPASNVALPPPQAQIAAPARPPEAPVAAPGSVIQQPAPDVRPNLEPPPNPTGPQGNPGARVNVRPVVPPNVPAQMPPFNNPGGLRPNLGKLPINLGEMIKNFRR